MTIRTLIRRSSRLLLLTTWILSGRLGSVNYGLKIRGAQEIKALSSSLVKANAADLIDGRKVA